MDFSGCFGKKSKQNFFIGCVEHVLVNVQQFFAKLNFQLNKVILKLIYKYMTVLGLNYYDFNCNIQDFF